MQFLSAKVILRFWQPQLLRVINRVIDSSLRGFATASLGGFSVPLIPTLGLNDLSKMRGVPPNDNHACNLTLTQICVLHAELRDILEIVEGSPWKP